MNKILIASFCNINLIMATDYRIQQSICSSATFAYHKTETAPITSIQANSLNSEQIDFHFKIEGPKDERVFCSRLSRSTWKSAETKYLWWNTSWLSARFIAKRDGKNVSERVCILVDAERGYENWKRGCHAASNSDNDTRYEFFLIFGAIKSFIQVIPTIKQLHLVSLPSQNRQAMTLFHFCIVNLNLDEVLLALGEKFGFDVQDQDGWTPILYLINSHEVKYVRYSVTNNF